MRRYLTIFAVTAVGLLAMAIAFRPSLRVTVGHRRFGPANAYAIKVTNFSLRPVEFAGVNDIGFGGTSCQANFLPRISVTLLSRSAPTKNINPIVNGAIMKRGVQAGRRNELFFGQTLCGGWWIPDQEAQGYDMAQIAIYKSWNDDSPITTTNPFSIGARQTQP